MGAVGGRRARWCAGPAVPNGWTCWECRAGCPQQAGAARRGWSVGRAAPALPSTSGRVVGGAGPTLFPTGGRAGPAVPNRWARRTCWARCADPAPTGGRVGRVVSVGPPPVHNHAAPGPSAVDLSVACPGAPARSSVHPYGLASAGVPVCIPVFCCHNGPSRYDAGNARPTPQTPPAWWAARPPTATATLCRATTSPPARHPPDCHPPDCHPPTGAVGPPTHHPAKPQPTIPSGIHQVEPPGTHQTATHQPTLLAARPAWMT